MPVSSVKHKFSTVQSNLVFHIVRSSPIMPGSGYRCWNFWWFALFHFVTAAGFSCFLCASDYLLWDWPRVGIQQDFSLQSSGVVSSSWSALSLLVLSWINALAILKWLASQYTWRPALPSICDPRFNAGSFCLSYNVECWFICHRPFFSPLASTARGLVQCSCVP